MDLKFPNYHQSQTSEATHVISRVFYGAEVYCILTEDIDKTEEEERKKSVENIGEKIDWRFTSVRKIGRCQETFLERRNQIHCPRQLSTVRRTTAWLIECSFTDGYIQILDRIKQILAVSDKVAQITAVPVAAEVCHLSVFVDQEARIICKHRISDADFVARWTRMPVELKQFFVLAEKMHSTNDGSSCRESISEFIRVDIN